MFRRWRSNNRTKEKVKTVGWKEGQGQESSRLPRKGKEETRISGGQQGREGRGGVHLPGPEGKHVWGPASDSWPHGVLPLQGTL